MALKTVAVGVSPPNQGSLETGLCRKWTKYDTKPKYHDKKDEIVFG